jgi:hypothetical protein
VARTETTARPMTEELAVAGLPAEPEIQEPGIAQLPEDDTSPATSGNGNREDGEIRLEGEKNRRCRRQTKRSRYSKAIESSPYSLCFQGI